MYTTSFCTAASFWIAIIRFFSLSSFLVISDAVEELAPILIGDKDAVASSLEKDAVASSLLPLKFVRKGYRSWKYRDTHRCSLSQWIQYFRSFGEFSSAFDEQYRKWGDTRWRCCASSGRTILWIQESGSGSHFLAFHGDRASVEKTTGLRGTAIKDKQIVQCCTCVHLVTGESGLGESSMVYEAIQKIRRLDMKGRTSGREAPGKLRFWLPRLYVRRLRPRFRIRSWEVCWSRWLSMGISCGNQRHKK